MTAGDLFRLVVNTRRQRAMLVGLCADGVVFLVLVAVYIYLRVHSTAWPIALHFANGLMAIAMTMFTLCGSFAMVAAVNNQAKGEFLVATRLTIAAIAVIGTFLICDAMEWARMVLFENATLATPFGATFFALSGYQALHAFAACFYLAAVAGNIKRSDVGACALFIHFTNLVWLVIFIALYLSNADLKGL